MNKIEHKAKLDEIWRKVIADLKTRGISDADIQSMGITAVMKTIDKCRVLSKWFVNIELSQQTITYEIRNDTRLSMSIVELTA